MLSRLQHARWRLARYTRSAVICQMCISLQLLSQTITLFPDFCVKWISFRQTHDYSRKRYLIYTCTFVQEIDLIFKYWNQIQFSCRNKIYIENIKNHLHNLYFDFFSYIIKFSCKTSFFLNFVIFQLFNRKIKIDRCTP